MSDFMTSFQVLLKTKFLKSQDTVTYMLLLISLITKIIVTINCVCAGMWAGAPGKYAVAVI